MKKLLSFPEEYILKKVLNSDKLRQEFDDVIMSNEMDYIEEKLRCFESGCIDYSIGMYAPNYFKIKKAKDFLCGVQKSISNFGASQKLESLCKLCEGLECSNLFEYHIQKLCDLYYEEQLKANIDYAEELSFAIYQKDETNKELLFQLENFEWALDGIYVDNQDRLCYMKYC